MLSELSRGPLKERSHRGPCQVPVPVTWESFSYTMVTMQCFKLYYSVITMSQRDLRMVNDPQGQKHRSLSGPALCISSNIEGLTSTKWDILANLCIQHSCDVLCLQEMHCGPSWLCPCISGMTLILEMPHNQYGSAIFIRNGLSVDNTICTDKDEVEIIIIIIKGISVTSIYKPPSVTFDIPPDVTSGHINVTSTAIVSPGAMPKLTKMVSF